MSLLLSGQFEAAVLFLSCLSTCSEVHVGMLHIMIIKLETKSACMCWNDSSQCFIRNLSSRPVAEKTTQQAGELPCLCES